MGCFFKILFVYHSVSKYKKNIPLSCTPILPSSLISACPYCQSGCSVKFKSKACGRGQHKAAPAYVPIKRINTKTQTTTALWCGRCRILGCRLQCSLQVCALVACGFWTSRQPQTCTYHQRGSLRVHCFVSGTCCSLIIFNFKPY